MDAEWSLVSPSETPSTVRLDQAVAVLADRQHGQVARRQLIALGFGSGAIKKRIERGHLRPVFPGVYSLGHEPRTRESRWMGGVLYAGPGTVLSHRPAAVHHGQLQFGDQWIEVTSPARIRLAAIRGYRNDLAADEVTIADGIPITTPARTVIDLAAVVDERALAYALNQIEVRRLYDPTGVQDLLQRHEGRRGIAKLRGLMPDTDDLRSPLERRFRERMIRDRFPPPRYNAQVALEGDFITVDALWEEQRIAVELDSHTFHDTPQQFERDRERDRGLRMGGYLPIRITSKQFEQGIAELGLRLR